MSPVTVYATGAELVYAFTAGLNAFDLPALNAMLAPEAQYAMLPKSIGIPPTQAENGLQMFASLRQIIPDFHVRFSLSFFIVDRSASTDDGTGRNPGCHRVLR